VPAATDQGCPDRATVKPQAAKEHIPTSQGVNTPYLLARAYPPIGTDLAPSGPVPGAAQERMFGALQLRHDEFGSSSTSGFPAHVGVAALGQAGLTAALRSALSLPPCRCRVGARWRPLPPAG
jgi:hypothetical protein